MTTGRQSLLACERELTRAERTGDAATLRALLARDFLGSGLDGQTVGRTAFITRFRRPELHFAKLRIDRVVVRFVGNIAIVNGRSQFVGHVAGRPFAGRARFMDVWAPQLKGWQLVASSVTPTAK